MQRLFSAVSILSLIALCSACLSKEEVAARRAWAFDVEGSYTQEDLDANGALQIENESDKNEVVLRFTRGDLFAGEEDITSRISDDTQRTQWLEQATLGLGESQLWGAFAGGENISRDFGASSEVWVGSEAVVLSGSTTEATDASFRAYTHLQIDNGSDVLDGTFTYVVTERRPDPTADEPDRTRIFTETERFDIRFTRDDGILDAEKCDNCTGEDQPETDDTPGDDGVPAETE
ncbi:MAG: hypothetical protein GY822_01430 [Deltaproteobacteria bacterium]|nr:hypothetical protein [Deltaproteobacteria bacterium]